MKLQGKIALVTGAGRGIGKGCALALASEGASLILNDLPDSRDVEDTTEEVRKMSGSILLAKADVFQAEERENLMFVIQASLNHVDILVSNPAVSIRGDFLHYKLEDFERVINGTLTSHFHMSQLVARHMVERGRGGKIIFISSVHAHMPYQGSVAYNAAKAGLNHMARTIARELAPHRINVNVIEPGWIDTPNERKHFGDEVMDKAGETLPWGRLGTPQDIGKAVAFLASDDADYITGAILRVDGGFVLKDL